MPDGGVDFALVWHMHQPDYRDYGTGEFRRPWVYLHALKDYSDMAWHLENQPGVRATVNFVPVLVDQLDDYARQFASGELRDPLLRLFAHPQEQPLGQTAREFLLAQCFHANHDKMVDPYPAYKRLKATAAGLESGGQATIAYLADAFFLDLVTWYHLSWTGESVRRSSPVVAGLMAKECGFSPDDRRALLAVCAEVVSDIVPRYRRLAENGRIELTTTPATHPIAPLLIDLAAAREADAGAVLPDSPVYPGGRQRTLAQVQAAIEAHERAFGAPPAGLWPAEGGISTEFVRALAGTGIRWTASGGAVLANSLRAAYGAPPAPHQLNRPYRLPGVAPELACFFRDDQLSDLIGFEYAKWHGKDAASDLVGRIEAIGRNGRDGERPLVTVILDGENAWEFYPYNGWYFLSSVYGLLAAHPRVRTVTPSSFLAESPDAAQGARRASTGELPRLIAGSWVYGTFSTWIGSTDKNRAWDLLCEAKRVFDLVVSSGRLTPAERTAAIAQLANCESSDWFWWFSNHLPAKSVASFDLLYRENLAALYRLLQVAPPPRLAEPVSVGAANARYEGAMMRSS